MEDRNLTGSGWHKSLQADKKTATRPRAWGRPWNSDCRQLKFAVNRACPLNPPCGAESRVTSGVEKEQGSPLFPAGSPLAT